MVAYPLWNCNSIQGLSTLLLKIPISLFWTYLKNSSHITSRCPLPCLIIVISCLEIQRLIYIFRLYVNSAIDKSRIFFTKLHMTWLIYFNNKKCQHDPLFMEKLAMLAFTVYCKFVLSGRILLHFAAIAGKVAFLPWYLPHPYFSRSLFNAASHCYWQLPNCTETARPDRRMWRTAESSPKPYTEDPKA